jgi:hypothetical protein
MGTEMPTGGKRRLDRILDPSYLEGLGDVPLDRLRSMREECEEEEEVLSYERRLLHGRLAILKAELDRRSSNSETKSLIDRLPEILSGDDQPSHRGAFPKLEAPPMFENPRRRVEKLVSDDTLARLPELGDSDIRSITETLRDAERDVSQARAALHEVLNPIIDELARRLSPADA